MAITTAMCTSYKRELLQAVHNHLATGGDSFRIALFQSAAVLGAGTTIYDGVNEAPATGGYSLRGQALVNIDPSSFGTTAFTQWTTPIEWGSSTITARGAQIFNETKGDKSVSVHDFGQEYSSVDGTFSVIMPTNDANTSLLRLV